MVEALEDGDAAQLASFPGPVFFPFLVKWWKAVVIGIALLVASAAARAIPDGDTGLTLAAAGMAVCGVVSILCGVVLALRPGAGLRLDATGFAVVGPLRRQAFRWSDVSDFAVWSKDKSSFVAFKAAKPRFTASDTMNATLTGGRNGLLPDTYGMTAGQLARLMTDWRNAAVDAAGTTSIGQGG